jgi:peroxiredoxin
MLTTFVIIIAGMFGSQDATSSPTPPAIGAKVANFTLPDINRQPWSLHAAKDKKAFVIVFIGTECPLANLYVPTLVDLHKQYAAKGVQFLAINANEQDTFDAVAAHARERKVPFPVLKDAEQKALDALGGRRTPEAFLLDANRVIRYNGRIDDQYGYTYKRAEPTRTELKAAIEALLAGKPVPTPKTEVQGCIIARIKNAGANPDPK